MVLRVKMRTGKEMAIGVIIMKNINNMVAALLAIMAVMPRVAMSALARNGTNLIEKRGLIS